MPHTARRECRGVVGHDSQLRAKSARGSSLLIARYFFFPANKHLRSKGKKDTFLYLFFFYFRYQNINYPLSIINYLRVCHVRDLSHHRKNATLGTRLSERFSEKLNFIYSVFVLCDETGGETYFFIFFFFWCQLLLETVGNKLSTTGGNVLYTLLILSI